MQAAKPKGESRRVCLFNSLSHFLNLREYSYSERCTSTIKFSSSIDSGIVHSPHTYSPNHSFSSIITNSKGIFLLNFSWLFNMTLLHLLLSQCAGKSVHSFSKAGGLVTSTTRSWDGYSSCKLWAGASVGMFDCISSLQYNLPQLICF